MKTIHLTAIALVLAALSVTSGAAAADPGRPYAYNVKRAIFGQHQIQLGTTERDVVDAFGVPNLRASDHVWMYYHNQAQETASADDHDCTILVVTFAHARVSDLKLVNASAARLIAAGAKSGTRVAFVPDRPPTLVAERR